MTRFVSAYAAKRLVEDKFIYYYYIDSFMPYKCPVPGCTRVLPTLKGLSGHLQMSHGIARPSKYLSKGENPPLKENLPYPEGKGQPKKINQVTLEVPSEEVQQTEHVRFSNRDLVTEVQPPEEYYEDSREIRLRFEQTALRKEIGELKAQILESMTPHRDIKVIGEELQRTESEEKISEENLTLPLPLSLPPLPELPFSDNLKSKIKMLNERELFR